MDSNYLSQNVAGVHYAVYAGTNGFADTRTGAVRITTFSADDPDGSTVQLTIAGVGALTVTGYHREIVELTDAHGGSHRLDLRTLTLQ